MGMWVFLTGILTRGSGFLSRKAAPPELLDVGPRKWLPIVDTDSCTGCGLCLQACDHGCFGMVWEFATLMRPVDCGSEGRCAEVCRDEVIRMGWVSLDGDARTGHWEARSASDVREPSA